MQELLVGLIVVFAFAVVIRRYVPVALQDALRMLMYKSAKCLALKRLAARWEQPLVAPVSCQQGCGSCGGCGSNTFSSVGIPAPKQH